MSLKIESCPMYELSSFDSVQLKSDLFGESRYSESQQLENPDKQMTRVCKDVLRVGRWRVGFTGEGEDLYWNVDENQLLQIAGNFQRQKENGIEHPLCWGHVEDGKPDIDPREVVCQIDSAAVRSGVLWISCYVSPVEAADLQNRKRQVSIGTINNFKDGEGETYEGHSLAHVGIVEHPVVPGQDGFIQLSLASDQTSKPNKGKSMFTLEPWVKALNSLLPDGSDIPLEGDGAISEDNADDMLALVMSLIGKTEVAEEIIDESGTTDGAAEGDIMPDTGDTPALEELPVEMRNQIRKDPALSAVFNHFSGKLGKAQQELSLLRASERKVKQDAYNSRLGQMGKSGLDAVTIRELQTQGKGNGYELSSLKPFERLCDPTLMGSQSVQLSNADPSNPSVKKVTSQEDIDRMASSLL